MNLSPFQKEEAVRNKLIKFFKTHTEGLTTTDIEKATKISRKTLEKHLQLLVRENELYMNQHGPTRVYYPHIYKTLKAEKLRFNNKIIWFNLIETEKNKFLLIKKSKLINNKWHFESSITIPIEQINDFYKLLEKFKN
jgi:predicted transcriptional regulator